MNCVNCYAKDQTISRLQTELSELRQRIVLLTGWKGKDSLSFKENKDSYIVITHQKPKQGVKPVTQKHVVLKRQLSILLGIIRGVMLNKDNKKTSFKELGVHIIKEYKLPYSDYHELMGNRQDYFTFFYYPAKVLDWLGHIKYSGRTITELKREK